MRDDDRTLEEAVWDESGRLVPLRVQDQALPQRDVAIIIVNRDRADLCDALYERCQTMGKELSVDCYVVDMGSSDEGRSRFSSISYVDSDFRGKAYGHNVGLRVARTHARYRYYWILMNDLVFAAGTDPVAELFGIMEANPGIGWLSPTETETAYQNATPVAGSEFRYVMATDYLALFMRGELIDKVGFLNPEFKYCWGAGQELSFKAAEHGWFPAYCDSVTMTHLGGTTYGVAKNVPSRSAYQIRARQFAARYFADTYGPDWSERFAARFPPDVQAYGTFQRQRQYWEAALELEAEAC